MKKYVKYIPDVIGFAGAFGFMAFGHFHDNIIVGAWCMLWGMLMLVVAMEVKHDRKIDDLSFLVEQLTCDEVDDAENPDAQKN